VILVRRALTPQRSCRYCGKDRYCNTNPPLLVQRAVGPSILHGYPPRPAWHPIRRAMSWSALVIPSTSLDFVDCSRLWPTPVQRLLFLACSCKRAMRYVCGQLRPCIVPLEIT
jgi:hypothetical protein